MFKVKSNHRSRFKTQSPSMQTQTMIIASTTAVIGYRQRGNSKSNDFIWRRQSTIENNYYTPVWGDTPWISCDKIIGICSVLSLNIHLVNCKAWTHLKRSIQIKKTRQKSSEGNKYVLYNARHANEYIHTIDE